MNGKKERKKEGKIRGGRKKEKMMCVKDCAWNTEMEKECVSAKKRGCVCVCERERSKSKGWKSLKAPGTFHKRANLQLQ